jgi:hypothetical protein
MHRITILLNRDSGLAVAEINNTTQNITHLLKRMQKEELEAAAVLIVVAIIFVAALIGLGFQKYLIKKQRSRKAEGNRVTGDVEMSPAHT